MAFIGVVLVATIAAVVMLGGDRNKDVPIAQQPIDNPGKPAVKDDAQKAGDNPGKPAKTLPKKDAGNADKNQPPIKETTNPDKERPDAPVIPVASTDGFVPLITPDLAKWGAKFGWRVEDGVFANTQVNGPGIMTRRKDYKDFQLRFEVRVKASGFLRFRSSSATGTTLAYSLHLGTSPGKVGLSRAVRPAQTPANPKCSARTWTFPRRVGRR